jgi:hypothetical protein
MKVIAFLTGYAVVDRIINHLPLTFFAERPRLLRSPIRKSRWRLRMVLNTYHNLLLHGGEKSIRFPTPFGLSACFPPAPRSIEPKLTSRSVALYDSPRRDSPKLGVKTSFGKHSRRRNAYKIPLRDCAIFKTHYLYSHHPKNLNVERKPL